MRATAAAFVGRPVKLRLRNSEDYFGSSFTPRWGTLREVRGDDLLMDDYHDSAGIGYEHGMRVIDAAIAIRIDGVVGISPA